jgi:hypothetical protein
MRKFKLGLYVTAALAVATVSPPAQSAELGQLVLSGASAGGFWSTLGAGLDSALRAQHPGSGITYQTSGGGYANLSLLQRRTVNLGIVYDVEARAALRGEPPFKEKIPDVRTVIQLFSGGPAQFFMTNAFATAHGITSIADLKDKKLPVRFANNRRGNSGSLLCERILTAAGVDFAQFPKNGGQVLYAASQEQIDLIGDGRLDLSCLVGVEKSSTFVEMGRRKDMNLLSIPDAAIKAVIDDIGGVDYTIPAATYDRQPTAIRSVGMATAVVTRGDMGEETVYELTKAWVQQLDSIKSVHRSLNGVTPADLTAFAGAPYHPGAIRYFKEAGLWRK